MSADAPVADLPAEAARCRQVERTYRMPGSGERVPALRGVDLELPRGSFTALMGPSGSGKSTLLRLLSCLDRADAGAVVIDGVDVTRTSRARRIRLRRERLGFVGQSPPDNLLEYLTVWQHLVLAARLRGRSSDAGLDELLDALRIADRASYLPRQLSGGEQQRAAIAFAAVGRPALLVADEPTGQLDHTAVGSVLDAFGALAASGVAVIAATHDDSVAARADRVIRMRDGEIKEAAWRR